MLLYHIIVKVLKIEKNARKTNKVYSNWIWKKQTIFADYVIAYRENSRAAKTNKGVPQVCWIKCQHMHPIGIFIVLSNSVL